MSDYNQDHHDIGITNVGSDGSGTSLIGMMLAKTEADAPAYEEYDSDFLADQFFTGAPSQEYTNPEKELIISQSDWRAGFGLEYADPAESKRYFSSIGMDMRHKGQAILGWTSTGISLLTSLTATIANGTMEAATSWTGGVGRSALQAHGGTYSWAVDITNGTAYQDAATWATTWRSRIFAVSGWIYCPANSSARISIADGVGQTNSSTVSGGAAWTQVILYRTLDASATQLRINLECLDETGGDVFFDDVVLSTPTIGKIVARAEFNNALYFAMGNILVKLNGTGDGFTEVRPFPATITWLEPFQVSGTDYLFICLGTSTSYEYMTTAEVFTISTATVKTFQFMKWVNTTADTMYGNDGVNTFRSTTNPLNGGTAWSAQTVVGDAANPITQLYTKSGALYIGKEDMMYYLNSSGVVQRDYAPELTSALSSHTCKNADIWQDEFFIPAGDQALLRAKDTNEWINPSKYCTNLADFSGQVEAVTHDEEWLYCAVDNSTKVEIMAGREEKIDGSTSWRWHPIHELTLTGVETIFVSTVYKKRLWITSTSSSDSLFYLPLPTKYGDITADSNRSFKTGVTFETSWLHGNFRADDKAWIKLTLTMGHTYNASRYFTLDYKKLGDSSWTNIGNYTGSSTSMTQSRYIDTTNKPFTSMMKFRFTGVTNDTTITPILLSYDVRAILYPSIKRLIHCVVRCAQDVTRKDGVLETNMYSTIKTTLDNARNNAKWVVSIRDIDGSTVNVKFLPVPRSMRRLLITKREHDRPKQEREYHVLMMEVSLS